jgi:Holliday junction resolvase RusA-like endonuclease
MADTADASDDSSNPDHPRSVVLCEGEDVEIRAWFLENKLVSIDGILKGRPIPKASVRWGRARQTNRVIRYMPTFNAAENLHQKLNNVLVFHDVMTIGVPLFSAHTPLHANITFHLQRPKTDFTGHNRLRGLAARARSWWFVGRPDLDNLTKFIFDVFTDVIFHDDKQIVSARLKKKYDNEGECKGRTCFRIDVLE